MHLVKVPPAPVRPDVEIHLTGTEAQELRDWLYLTNGGAQGGTVQNNIRQALQDAGWSPTAAF